MRSAFLIPEGGGLPTFGDVSEHRGGLRFARSDPYEGLPAGISAIIAFTCLIPGNQRTYA